MSRPQDVSALAGYEAAVEAALATMKQDRIPERIWAHDHTVWKPDPTEIANRLGWLDIAGRMREHLDAMQELAAAVREAGYTHVLLLGMGGSSLAPEVFFKTLGAAEGYPSLTVLDSTDPGAVLSARKAVDLAHTLFVVSTKSGGTVETLSAFRYFYNQVADQVGRKHAGEHFIAITDAGSKLEKLAHQHGFRAVFLNDPNIGGRYSALSYFGLLPAALIGANVSRLITRAMAAAEACSTDVSAENNPGLWLGAVIAELAKAGRDKLTLVISEPVASFGDWAEQLVAESTGKEGKGILPVVGEPLLGPEVYGDDRLFVHLQLGDDATYVAALQKLEEAGHPVVRLRLADLYDLGIQMYLWEFATAAAGHLLGINPFDQPDVEAAKVLARKVVDEFSGSGMLPLEKAAVTGQGISLFGAVQAAALSDALTEFLGGARPGDYIAIQAYVQPTPAVDQALAALRLRLLERFHLATTVGYGPRFLHSTGQLHKGDAGKGVFIQLTADMPVDVPIPDEVGSSVSTITFGILKTAQALGDGQALRSRGRRVIRLHLDADVPAALARLTEVITHE
ncbi:MAG: hypothetical protein Kow00124_15390 [Anaerolineae bacterium]